MALNNADQIEIDPKIFRQTLNHILRYMSAISGKAFREIDNYGYPLNPLFNTEAGERQMNKAAATVLMVAGLQREWRFVVKSHFFAAQKFNHLVEGFDAWQTERDVFNAQHFEKHKIAKPTSTDAIKDKIEILKAKKLIGREMSESEKEASKPVCYGMIRDAMEISIAKVRPDPYTISLFALFNKKEERQIAGFVPVVKDELIAHVNIFTHDAIEQLNHAPASVAA